MGGDARLTADPDLVADADGVVLPGVGAFGACMDALRESGLEQPALDAVASGRPFLGICVGMQMLFDASEEDRDARGLGVIPGTIRWIPAGVQAPADAMEPARDSGSPTTRCSASSATSRGCTSCTRCTACPTIPTSSPPRASTAASSTPRSGSATCSPPSSIPRSRARRALQLLANFVRRVRRVTRAIELYPAIDLRDGRVVRLTQGDYDAETVYGDDPVAVADRVRRRRRDVGARRRPRRRAHRRPGQPRRSWLASPRRSPVGAGCRPVAACARSADVEALADAGVARVVMGSAAVREPELVAAASRDHAGGGRARPPRRRAGRARLDRGQRRASRRGARARSRRRRRS